MSKLKNQNYEIWFLTGTQSLYGDETLQQVAAQSLDVAQILAKSTDSPVEIIWEAILKSPKEIQETLQSASASKYCIGIIVLMHTFSPAKMWISGLRGLTKPLLHLHTQVNSQLPWETINMDFMNLNQAANGDREHGAYPGSLEEWSQNCGWPCFRSSSSTAHC